MPKFFYFCPILLDFNVAWNILSEITDNNDWGSCLSLLYYYCGACYLSGANIHYYTGFLQSMYPRYADQQFGGCQYRADAKSSILRGPSWMKTTIFAMERKWEKFFK